MGKDILGRWSSVRALMKPRGVGETITAFDCVEALPACAAEAGGNGCLAGCDSKGGIRCSCKR